MSFSSTTKYDVVIFGASGFTGKFVVEEIHNICKSIKSAPFSFAVAGRNEYKLKGNTNHN